MGRYLSAMTIEIAAQKLADSRLIAGRQPVEGRPCNTPEATQRKGRSRATNDPFFASRCTIGRKAQARRRRDLVAIFLDSLAADGPPSDLMLVAVRRAVELTLACEVQRAIVLNGSNNAAGLDALIKLEGECRRAMRALGLNKPEAKRPLSMRDRLEAEAAAVAAEDEAEAVDEPVLRSAAP
jgi:hypothetical protein